MRYLMKLFDEHKQDSINRSSPRDLPLACTDLPESHSEGPQLFLAASNDHFDV